MTLIDDWLEGVRCQVNVEQHIFLEIVVDRLAVELGLKDAGASHREDGTEPLRHLLHGPPGTGKSHVLKFVQELFALAGLKKGIDYQFVAFQATNAADLDGDTIHHAFGWNTNKRSFEQAMKPEAAKQLAYCRWLFIDEISLVPADLFAQVDHCLREVKPSADAWKHDPLTGNTRPLAGVNVILVGDFKQLPPPQGGNLADVPHHLRVGPHETCKAPDPMADAGRRLMWEDIEGMVELTDRERCKDEWWNEVTDELRAGHLSENNWRYLHGYPVEGCKLSKEERESRRRVIDGPGDPRLREARFQEAPVIVANNDAKYQINKDRAKKYAQDANAQLRWSVAKDVASTETLQAQACDKERKIKWLQYHDKDTGNLLGTLPLAIGMKVALTEHIDRSEDKSRHDEALPEMLAGEEGRRDAMPKMSDDQDTCQVHTVYDDNACSGHSLH
ncbi:unnamed protein product [Durusdinium trenchii]|uniref:ATP-dependent DNA helicase n=1 Tax=Durusdinium trenchii TaxID=1381693 RepID=A0ABP0QQB6_9DINO